MLEVLFCFTLSLQLQLCTSFGLDGVNFLHSILCGAVSWTCAKTTRAPRAAFVPPGSTRAAPRAVLRAGARAAGTAAPAQPGGVPDHAAPCSARKRGGGCWEHCSGHGSGAASDCFHLHHFLGVYFPLSVSTPPRPLVTLSFFLSFPFQFPLPLHKGEGESARVAAWCSAAHKVKPRAILM